MKLTKLTLRAADSQDVQKEIAWKVGRSVNNLEYT